MVKKMGPKSQIPIKNVVKIMLILLTEISTILNRIKIKAEQKMKAKVRQPAPRVLYHPPSSITLRSDPNAAATDGKQTQLQRNCHRDRNTKSPHPEQHFNLTSKDLHPNTKA